MLGRFDAEWYSSSSMQLSSQSVSDTQTQQMFDQLHTLLADITKPEDMQIILAGLLTETEHTVFAKRLAIAQMLHQEKSYKDIRAALKVSSATISSVNDLTNKPGLKLALKYIKADQWAEGLINRWFKK